MFRRKKKEESPVEKLRRGAAELFKDPKMRRGAKRVASDPRVQQKALEWAKQVGQRLRRR